MAEARIIEHSAFARHGRKVEYFTIAWNSLEGLVVVIAGAVAGSISLVGFGIDQLHRSDVRGCVAVEDVG